MRTHFYILCAVFGAFLGYGQVSVVSETNAREYEVNEPFKLNIGVEIEGNLEQQTPIKLPDLSKFEILGNASEIFSFIDPETGTMVRQTVYQLVLEPKQAGKIKIGSALVQVNGKIYKSEAFDIIVKEAKKTSELAHHRDVFLSMEALNGGVYENEPIKIVLRAYGKNFSQFRKVHQVKLPHQVGNIYSISLDKKDIEVNSNDFASQVLASFIFFPDKAGNIIIPPAMAKLSDENISSNELKINIKPLPKDAPKSFKNAVGNFELTIDADEKTEINKGFDVWVKLSGEGNLHDIELPKILESEDYQVFKPKKDIKTSPQNNTIYGEITEHYIVIPKKEGEISLSLEEFTFFNPKKQKYQSIQLEHSVESLSPEDLTEENSTLSQVFDNTEHLLKKVDLIPVSEKEKPLKNNWLSIFVILGLGGTVAGILWLLRRKNKKKEPVKLEKITTIAETEEKIKHSLFIGKEYYFRSIKNAIDNDNSPRFFEEYEELHYDVQQQVELYEQKGISQFLQENVSEDFAQEYRAFREQISQEKYAPTHGDLYEFYNNIVKFYSQIMK